MKLLSILTITAGLLCMTPKSPIVEGVGMVHVVSKEANVDLTTDKAVQIQGDIDEDSWTLFAKQFERIVNKNGPLVVFIESSGGDIRYGNLMMKLLFQEQLKGVTLVCVGLTEADSMAFNIFSMCNIRLAHYTFRAVAHKVEVRPPDTIRLTALNLRAMAEDLDRVDEPYARLNAWALRMSREEYNFYADKEKEWNAFELVSRGYLQGFAEVSQ